MRKITTILAALVAICAMGCATVHLKKTCPATSTGVAFGLQGSTVGNQVISMIGSAATKAGVLARAAAAAPSEQSTMDYTYIPIFGSDGGSITCPEPAPPSTTIITVPAGPPAAQVLQ